MEFAGAGVQKLLPAGLGRCEPGRLGLGEAGPGDAGGGGGVGGGLEQVGDGLGVVCAQFGCGGFQAEVAAGSGGEDVVVAGPPVPGLPVFCQAGQTGAFVGVVDAVEVEDDGDR